MAQNLSIKCEKWKWKDTVTDLTEISFLSSPSLREPLDTIELSDFILANSNPVFAYQKEDIDQSGSSSSLQLFGSYNSLTLELSNLTDRNLISFFNFFDSASNFKIRYKIQAFYNEELIFQGVLSPDNIEYFHTAKIEGRETLNITIYSWEKEFKEYYSKKNLIHHDSLAWRNEDFGWEYITMSDFMFAFFGLRESVPGITPYPPQLMYFDKGIEGDKSLKDWNMVRYTRLDMLTDFYENYMNFFWFPNSYGHIQVNFEFSRFEFLKKLCNAMGWVFHYKFFGSNIKFVLRNRYTNDSLLGRRIHNFSDLISYSVSYSQYNQNIDAVSLPVLELKGDTLPFFGKGHLRGSKDYVVSSNPANEPSKSMLHFSVIRHHLDDDHNVYEIGESSNTVKLDYKDDLVYKYIEYQGPAFTSSKTFQYPANQVLPIDGGDNDWSIKTKKKLNFSHHTAGDYPEGSPVIGGDFIYIGNFGTMMFRKNGSFSDITRYVTINYTGLSERNYILSDQFNKNISALLSKSTNLIIECEITGFYPFPDEIISFSNAPVPFNVNFEILSVEADYINNTTKYQLRKR